MNSVMVPFAKLGSKMPLCHFLPVHRRLCVPATGATGDVRRVRSTVIINATSVGARKRVAWTDTKAYAWWDGGSIQLSGGLKSTKTLGVPG